MCGINAIYAFRAATQPAAAEELIRTRDAMRARGPDAAGAWFSPDRHVALGHRRLTIIDLDHRADQPMLAPGGRSAIVFNGEIYNYRELRAELEAAGEVFSTTSDTEVLLRMYLREGPGMLPRLRGMYAFAVWNDDTRTMFLARDPYGIKPLYYANDGGTLRVASQVKALLAGGVSTTRDPAGIAGFLLRGSVPEPYTMYQAIRALPAGHWMEVTPAGAGEPRAHFSIAEAWRAASERHLRMTQEERQAVIGDAVRESVRYHLVSDVPVGAFLSGVTALTVDPAGNMYLWETVGTFDGVHLGHRDVLQLGSQQAGLDLERFAIGDHGTDAQIVLIRVAEQQRGERGQERDPDRRRR